MLNGPILAIHSNCIQMDKNGTRAKGTEPSTQG